MPERSEVVFSTRDEWTPWHSAHGMRNISVLSCICAARRRLCWFSWVSVVTFNLRVILEGRLLNLFGTEPEIDFVDGDCVRKVQHTTQTSKLSWHEWKSHSTWPYSCCSKIVNIALYHKKTGSLFNLIRGKIITWLILDGWQHQLICGFFADHFIFEPFFKQNCQIFLVLASYSW